LPLLPLVAAADSATIIVDVDVIDVVVIVVTPLCIVLQCNRMLLSFR
jgi:hypothetical protein